MNRNKLIKSIKPVCFAAAIASMCLWGTPINADFPLDGTLPLTKAKHAYTLEWKRYDISSVESISLYGAKERKFITDNWYWGEAGYGAITGRRAGYLEGGIISGYMGNFSNIGVFDVRMFIGAGGGGQAPQGGGLIVHPTVGLGVALTKQISVVFEVGYIKFLNGDIDSVTFGFNTNFFTWAVSAPDNPKRKDQ